MKKLGLQILLILGVTVSVKAQNTIPTTTCTGAMKIVDSLNVQKSINAIGDIKTSGELVAKDTMRAQKDVIVDGNIKIGGDINVVGTSVFAGRVELKGLNTMTASIANPCDFQTLAIDANDGHLLQINSVQASALEDLLSTNPCPQPPVIPFTWQTFGNHVNNNNRWIGTIENFDFNIKTNNTLRMVVKNNGQILFGAKKINATHLHANAQYQFDGKIACKELVVVDPTKWADFVFEKNYKLLPLKDVEAYYIQNKHLPNVPSEKEVKENGINTADMDAVLLQKIEELTLYIVQQQKEIEALKKEIKK